MLDRSPFEGVPQTGQATACSPLSMVMDLERGERFNDRLALTARLDMHPQVPTPCSAPPPPGTCHAEKVVVVSSSNTNAIYGMAYGLGSESP
jgi:hypothetical protein